MTWTFGDSYELSLQVDGSQLQGWIAGEQIFDVSEDDPTLRGGGVALVCEEGRVAIHRVIVQPID